MAIIKVPDPVKSALIDDFRRSFDDEVHPSTYRNFGCWALRSQIKHKEAFLTVLGHHQIVKMTYTVILPALTRETVFEDIAHVMVASCTWLTHEFLSDSFAAGLSLPSELDCPSQLLRRNMLLNFNEQTKLALLRGTADRDSLFKHFKHNNQMHSLFPEMLKSAPLEPLIREFASSVWSNTDKGVCIAAALSANTVSAVRACGSVCSAPLRAMVIHFATQRYTSSSEFLTSDSFFLQSAVNHAAMTSMVAPLLGIYCSAVAEARGEENKLAATNLLPVLKQSLTDAAILVRLLNDLGPYLMTGSVEYRSQLLADLEAHIRGSVGATINESVAQITDRAFTRIKKDALLKETNVSLHGIAHLPSNDDVRDEVVHRIKMCAKMYEDGKTRLEKSLRHITTCMKHGSYQKLIASFVHYHEIMYGQYFDSEEGDYAAVIGSVL